MFQFGKDGVGILDTKAGQTLFGKEKDGQFEFSPLKLGSIGVSALSLIQNSKTPDEAGTALAALQETLLIMTEVMHYSHN